MVMGFTEKKVTKALKNCVSLFNFIHINMNQDNNPDRAAEWLFSHMDEPESDEEMKDESSQQNNEYIDERPGYY